MKNLILSNLQRFIHCAGLYRCDLTDRELYPEKEITGYKYLVLDTGGILKNKYLIDQERGGSFGQVIDDRIESGNYNCYVFVHEESGIFAYTRWACNRFYASKAQKKKISLKDNEIFTLNSYTHPSHRYKGLHREMNVRMLNHFISNTGYNFVYMEIDCFLNYLIDVVTALDYIRIKKVVFYKKGSLKFYLKRLFQKLFATG